MEEILLFTPRLLTKQEAELEPSASYVFRIADAGFQYALFSGNKLDTGKQLVLEHMAETQACYGEIGVDYILHALEKDNMDIFVWLVGTEERDSVQLTLSNKIPLGFILCSRSPVFGISIELLLICATRFDSIVEKKLRVDKEQKRVLEKLTQRKLKLELGARMMYYMLQYYNRAGLNIRLYATTENLVLYYASLGFVLVPLDETCPPDQDYTARWDEIVNQIVNDPMRKSLELVARDTKQMPAALARYYQLQLFDALVPGNTKDDFYWMPGEGVGYYMVYCQQLATERIHMSGDKAAMPIAERDVQAFLSTYRFELNVQLLDVYARKIT